jgi:phospholipid-binding lipoprotein MlaA
MFSGSRLTFFQLVCVLVTAMMSSSLYAGGAAGEFAERDPWEGMNRKIHNFNEVMDRYLLKPAASGYEKVLPDRVEDRISNVFDNLFEVRNIVNDLLQGKFKLAANDTGRFLINSTVGIVGLFDVAQKVGLPKSEGEDFGQTLNAWGVAEGPYVVLPFFGPKTLTSAVGTPVDGVLNPVRYIDHVPTRNTTYGVDILDSRAGLLETEKLISGDKYAFIRAAYLQRREYLIQDGAVEDSFGSDDEEF